MKKFLKMVACVALFSAPSVVAYAANFGVIRKTVEQTILALRPADISAAYILANGTPTFLGTITATAATPKDNGTTAVPFTIAPGSTIEMQCAAAVHWLPGLASAWPGDASTITLQANVLTPPFSLQTGSVQPVNVAIDPVTGTTSCVVFLMR